MTPHTFRRFPAAALGSLVTFCLWALMVPAEELPWSAGAASVDVTPDYPVRLSGFGFRRQESQGIRQRLRAGAIAFGATPETLAVLIAVDNLGIPASMVAALAERLEVKAGLRRERLAIAATHTHSAPMLSEVCPTLFGVPIPAEHQERIERYTRELADGLERAALEAIASRAPARLEWAIGKVGFARNRRTKDGPVDHELPVLAVRGADGAVRAIHASYACHCVTLSDDQVNGDWAGYAREALEAAHPGTVALVSIGCGADQNPDSGVTGSKAEAAAAQGKQIAGEAERLLGAPMRALRGDLAIRLERLHLPLAELPSLDGWKERERKGGALGYHAGVQIARLGRGEKLKTKIVYPISTWSFGDGLAMVFLPGEVVVDYALRLKSELDRERLWVVAYANDAPCYIPSERILKEGGYEGGDAMIYYDVPTRFRPGLEAAIIESVHRQVGAEFRRR